jgi:hypothetical protein
MGNVMGLFKIFPTLKLLLFKQSNTLSTLESSSDVPVADGGSVPMLTHINMLQQPYGMTQYLSFQLYLHLFEAIWMDMVFCQFGATLD